MPVTAEHVFALDRYQEMESRGSLQPDDIIDGAGSS